MRKLSIVFLVGLLTVQGTQPSTLASQVIHIPPVYRPVIHKDVTVLEIKAKKLQATAGDTAARAAIDLLDGTTFAIQEDQLVIARQGSGIETITLGDRKIRDVIADLQLKYKDSLIVSSKYPLSSTELLKSTDPENLKTGFKVKANPDEPVVGLGFGVVFALSDEGASGESGLLSDAGFQLDLTGSHQFVSPGKNTKGFLPDWVIAQARLGLNANQQLNVETEGDINETSATGAQFGAALEQANQVGLTGQVDWTFPLNGDRMDLILSFPSYGVSWTQLEDFEFPPIAVADTFVTAEAVFADVPLTAAREELDRVLPLSEIGANAVFQFRRNGVPNFYAGGGVVYKEIPVRQVSFTQVDGDSLPVRNSLVARLDNPMDWYWRAMFGARIAGVLDVRLDAAGPLGDRDGQPLLRILLGHAFPVIKE